MPASYLHLSPGGRLPQRTPEPFRAVLIAEMSTDGKWRRQVSDWLVRSGCLYFIAWGILCEEWHDGVDASAIKLASAAAEDSIVLTTWHDGEPLCEALWFAANIATHPMVDLNVTLLIHIAPSAQSGAVLGAYRAAAKRVET
jgi:hypothetical protein